MADIATPSRFLLRLPPGLHTALRQAAHDSGLSLNQYCVRRLASPPALPEPRGLAQTIERAAAITGPDLVGVAVFGSWARGEATSASDIDVLIVAESRFNLTRSAYDTWDATPLSIDGRRVEAHVVRMPAAGTPPTGLWAEVAIDGLVVFERGMRLSSFLATVRRRILTGRMVRRTIHGQPYWNEVA